MRAFSDGKIAVLVSTTVVEVGVDVPNATVMAIFDADRFGLSQLHQLRGRVGRGQKAAQCLLIADPKNEQGIARMEIMTKTNDGFLLAQKIWKCAVQVIFLEISNLVYQSSKSLIQLAIFQP